MTTRNPEDNRNYIAPALEALTTMRIQEAIAKVKARVAQKTPDDEQATRHWVIDPLLEADELGYDIRDIVFEERNLADNRADYTILPDTEHMFFVEAKKWGAELQDRDADQATSYPHTAGKQWAVLTNGKEWRLYDDHIKDSSPKKLVAIADLDDPKGLEGFLRAIGKDSVTTGGLEVYAAAQLELERERLAALAEKERTERIRAALPGVLADPFSKPESELVSRMYAVLKRDEAMRELEAGDIAEYFSKLVARAQQPERPMGPPDSEGFTDTVSEVLKERGNFDVLHKTGSTIWFLPKPVVRILPENAAESVWKQLRPRVSVCCWIGFWPKKAQGEFRGEFTFECCQMRDNRLRLQFVNALKEEGFSLTKKAFEADAIYSRFRLEKDLPKFFDVHQADAVGTKRDVQRILDANTEGFKRLQSVCKKVFKA